MSDSSRVRSVAAAILLLTGVGPWAAAATAARDQFLPSVGHGQGACPGGVCSEWRTDVWIFNPGDDGEATVTVELLLRQGENPAPSRVSVEVAAGHTARLVDVVATTFGVASGFGALRFVADREVVVTGRIYDENVHTNLGTGTAGQFFAALPAAVAIGRGEVTDLVGLRRADDGSWRSNFGLVETTGGAVTVVAELLDGEGGPVASATYQLGGFGAQQLSIASVGGPAGDNRRLRLRVSEGDGRVLAFASVIDGRTGDPSTVEMVAPPALPSSGRFEGVVMSPDGIRIDGGLGVDLTAAGVVGFAGVAGLPCGDDVFSVDFFLADSEPVDLDDEGRFALSVTVPYVDGTTTLFSVVWTLEGALEERGWLAGTLQSETSEGVGAWIACEGTVSRPWRAGWTGVAATEALAGDRAGVRP